MQLRENIREFVEKLILKIDIMIPFEFFYVFYKSYKNKTFLISFKIDFMI